MSASGGNRAIIAAMLANLGIAVTKLIAAVFSGSGAMLAEAVHSFADTINQVLLLVGGRRSRKAADDEHPFGYGRARYLYAFLSRSSCSRWVARTRSTRASTSCRAPSRSRCPGCRSS